MKILYHHRIQSKDGQFVHVEELTKALIAAGHELVFVGPASIERNELGSDAGLTVWMKDHIPRFIYEILELGYSVLDFLRVARAIRKHRPDCIYERYNLFFPSGIWAKKLFRLPLLLEVNAPLFAERSKYDGISLRRLARSIEKYTWRRADFVLPVTEVLAGIVRAAGVAPDRIQVIPNGIDPARFSNAPSRHQAKINLGLDERFVLGFTGFVRDWHGLERVLEYLASADGRDMHLILVGDGPAKQSLFNKSAELGVSDRFTVTGTVSRERIPEYLAAFDIALQPAVVSYASPLKLFEYLALGHAIVAPATANIMEILADGRNALLFDPASDEEFFACIRRLHDDQRLKESVSENARLTIHDLNLTWQGNAEKVVQLFCKLGVRHDLPVSGTEPAG